MAGFKALSMGAKAALLAGGAAAVALAGYGAWSLRKAPVTTVAAPADQVAPVAIAPKDPVPDLAQIAPKPAAETAQPAAAPEPAPDATVPAEAVVPSFDVVRVDPDGTTVVAGRADPGSKIVLRVDGAEISATTADQNGNFAAFFVLETRKTPRLLTMTSILPNQSEVSSAAEVALAPTQAPVVVAAVEPEASLPETTLPEASPPEATAPTPEPQVAAIPDAPAALLVTKDGVKVLQSGNQTAATDPVAALSIDTISYTPTGDVQLAGHAAAGAFLRIYLDNAPLVDVKAGEDGLWASTMPPIAPGIYTLRADQLAADGSVTARFETPFKRETQDALVAAIQTPEPAVAVPEPEPEPDAAVAVAEVEPKAEAAATPEPKPTAADDAAAPVVVADATSSPTATPPVSITVQPGFTLWGIASKQFGDGVMYVQVFEANKDKIRDPDLIYPGQVFVIPAASE